MKEIEQAEFDRLEATLDKSFGRPTLEKEEEGERMVEAVTLRLQSFSPMDEAEAETRSLELPSPAPQDGRRSTQGIPEVMENI